LPVAESAILWSLFKGLGSWRGEPFDSQTRKDLKLKVKEVELGLEALRSLDGHKRSEIFHEGLPESMDQLFEQPTAVAERLGAVWRAQVGSRESFSTELLTALAKDGGFDDPRNILMSLLNPPVFKSEGKVVHLKKEKRLELQLDGETPGAFEFEECVSVVNYMFHALPVGDRFRQAVPARFDALWEVVQRPEFLLQVDSPLETLDDEEFEAFWSRLGENKTVDGVGYFDDGVAVVLRGRWGAEVAIYTAAYLRGQVSPYADPHTTGIEWLHALGASQALVERMRSTPLKPGQFEANPAHSVPDVHAQVVQELGLSAQAATAFLQVLALPEPTLNNLKVWNGWSAAEIKKAFGELVEKKLVLEAKRARAGRPYFVDGPWIDSRLTTPVEGWKVSMYGPELTTKQRLLSVPCHALFELAWKRWLANDRPGF
jgi:hypothetical protein